MHQVVVDQLLADDPPETWQTVQRLVGLGYDWRNIMHMILAGDGLPLGDEGAPAARSGRLCPG